jgi:hypothetical protein
MQNPSYLNLDYRDITPPKTRIKTTPRILAAFSHTWTLSALAYLLGLDVVYYENIRYDEYYPDRIAYAFKEI